MPEHVFEITNVGTDDLVIGDIRVEGEHPLDFTITNDDASGQTLAPQDGETPAESETFGVTFAPLGEGVRSAVVVIPSNDPSSPYEVHVTGTGTVGAPVTAPVASATPVFVVGDPVRMGDDSTYSLLTITNIGTANLTIGSVAITSDDPNWETDVIEGEHSILLDGDDLSSETLAPGASIEQWIEFLPTSVGVKTAVLSIPSDDAASPLEVELYGTVLAEEDPAPEPVPYQVNRMYLTRLGIPSGVTLPSTHWDLTQSDSTTPRYLSPVKGGPAVVQTAGNSTPAVATAPRIVRMLRFVSPPLAAQDLSGQTLRCYMQVAAASGVNAQGVMLIRRWNVADDSSTFLAIAYGGPAAADPWATALVTKRVPVGGDYSVAFPAAVFAAGDRLIIEVGGRVHVASPNPNLRARYGAATTDVDLPETIDSAMPNAAPWIDFCPGILLLPEELPA